MVCLSAIFIAAWFYTAERTAESIASKLDSIACVEEQLRSAAAREALIREAVQDLHAKHLIAQDIYSKMVIASDHAETFKAAKFRYESLLGIVESQKYRMLHELSNCDWRSLRGIPFELFLKRVFEAHGYDVQSTKVSNDQGLDLIAEARGRRIGVQVKGYADSVGVSAVQEAHTGMAAHKCHCCVVITNSDFTPYARTLAKKVGCLLIAGRDIQQLISGEIVFGE